MNFDELEEVAFGQLHLAPETFYDMDLRQYDNAVRGLEYSRQLTASNFREIVTVLWNTNRGKSPAKTQGQIWPLPLIDKHRPGSKLKTRDGKIKMIEARGYTGIEKLTDKELKWFWEKAISGTFGFDDKQVEENKKEVLKFCKLKKIGRG